MKMRRSPRLAAVGAAIVMIGMIGGGAIFATEKKYDAGRVRDRIW